MGELSESSPIGMRTREVKLSDEEHRALTNYKEAEYPEHTPYGYIIGQLIEDVTDD